MAYAQLVKEHIHVCNALMIFAALEREESMAQRIILYPKAWDKQSSDRETSNSQLETSMRLLRNAASRFRVMLQPVEPVLSMSQGMLSIIILTWTANSFQRSGSSLSLDFFIFSDVL